ncbi:glycosyltransferase [Ferruginibacter lapsinanis]|uniref:glycosyltransferase n=1 Tax=Ferruginibacter lapsinanis TaxID=563172 RepID=UPI001E4C55CB|nr:glycosyltransferase [Ferruginibacter lapsinanis]UEG50553.1 glycosyltransferase [Ferruginibacter lapsinanis]
MKTVLSIIVTYNRLPLLKRCIDALKAQSYGNNSILVINNSSTDGTEEYLKANTINFITQPNGGSSAGWYTGIEASIKGNYDFVWLMDDDGYPDPDALKHLVNSFDHETIGVSSVVVKENNHEELVFGLPKLNTKGYVKLFSLIRKYHTISEVSKFSDRYPYIHAFNGTLLDVNKIKAIGNVDKRYFMYGDELDYMYRLEKLGKLYTIIAAKHYHPDVSARAIDKHRVYYFIRNSIIINHLYLDKAYVRDFFTVAVALYRVYKRCPFKEFVSYLFWKNTVFLYQGVIDGYKKNMVNKFV